MWTLLTPVNLYVFMLCYGHSVYMNIIGGRAAYCFERQYRVQKSSDLLFLASNRDVKGSGRDKSTRRGTFEGRAERALFVLLWAFGHDKRGCWRSTEFLLGNALD